MQEMKDWATHVFKTVGARGPRPCEYAAVQLAFEWVRKHVPDYRQFIKDLLIDPHEDWLKEERLQSSRPFFNFVLHIWHQPRGYAGDGDLLTKLYRALDTPLYDERNEPVNPWSFSRWDSYIASRPECLALQSRKEYQRIMAAFCAEKGCTSWLDIACGVGEFTKEVFMEQGDRITRVTGLDNDPMSITIAQNRNSAGYINFICANALKELPEGDYDCVYSAGLFDYLDDRLFIKLGKKFLTKNPKVIMIGNIGQSHPTKALMSCLGWDLFDRSRFDLLELGHRICPTAKCDVETDRTGIQHYLRIMP